MRKKIFIAITILFVLIIGGYLFIRFDYLKSEDFKPDTSKEKSATDLRPALIAKLKQVVKNASHGLYVLHIEKIEPNLLSSKLDVWNASITVDTTVMLYLDSLQLLPDDLFKFHIPTLHVDGIGIADLLNKNSIDITGIQLTNPVIDMYHYKRSYNLTRKKDTSLFKKFNEGLKRVSIGNANIVNGTFINHNRIKNKSQKFLSVSISANDMIIDSASKNDKDRFMFAKNVRIRTKNYSVPTADGLYFFKAGDISISGESKTITALNVELQPRYNRQQFQNKLQFGKDMYNLSLPSVVLKDVNWQAIINNESFIASEANIAGGSFKIFYNRSKPQGPFKMDNFPHQVWMKLPFPFSVKKANIRDLNFSYEEHNPLTGKNGTVYFDNLHATISNISNIYSDIKKEPFAAISANTLFMHHVPMNIMFRYDLSKPKTGEFVANIKIGAFDNKTVNPIAEPLGLFSVKTGEMQKAVVQVEGNNFRTKGNITMHYKDLRISPLKKDDDGTLQKKTVTGFLANLILIKNENPKDAELRQPSFTIERGTHKNFFNLLWTSVLMGIVKTIGVPEKFVRK